MTPRGSCLIAGLSLLIGTEAMYVLRDICRLERDEASSVTAWAARTLIVATLDGPG